MKPASFDYHAPPTLAEAVELMARLDEEGVDAKILAGGQSLMPMLAMRVARPEVLVDLGKIKSLDYIREESGAIAIGAMTSKRAAEASALIERQQPLFHAATKLVGHRQIRNRGSVGGSFAHADPASEYPAVALVLDIVFKAVGPEGERTIPAGDFFVTYMTTSLESTEVLTEVRLPVLPAGTRRATPRRTTAPSPTRPWSRTCGGRAAGCRCRASGRCRTGARPRPAPTSRRSRWRPP